MDKLAILESTINADDAKRGVGGAIAGLAGQPRCRERRSLGQSRDARGQPVNRAGWRSPGGVHEVRVARYVFFQNWVSRFQIYGNLGTVYRTGLLDWVVNRLTPTASRARAFELDTLSQE